MTRLWNDAATAAAASCTVLLMLLFSSCSSDKVDSQGLPTHLPDIHLSGSTATPPHAMASYEYPFDSGGRYVTSWAAEGEKRAGRSASATNDDSSKWSKSHGTSSSRGKTASTSRKSSSSPSKTTTTSKTASKSASKPSESAPDDAPPTPKVTSTSSKSKSGTSTKAKPASAKSGRSYTVKKGDTLSHIASQYGTSVAKIKAANGMSSDFLSIGKVLRIP